MDSITVDLTVRSHGNSVQTKAAKLRFSMCRCFVFDDGPGDLRCLMAIADHLVAKKQPVAFYGAGPLCSYFLKHVPELKSCVPLVLSDDPAVIGKEIDGIPVIAPGELPQNIRTVFLCETKTVPCLGMRKKLPGGLEILTVDILKEIDWKAIPARAWIPDYDTIYPLDLPDIEFLPNQDMILIDCPARNLALMPNGLAYVHNALKKTSLKFQTVDLDILIYHRYHMHRLLDAPVKMLAPKGHKMASDPWLAEAYDEWQNPDVIEYFRPEIDEIVEKLVQARPKILGLSIQACNIRFARELVNGVKARLPETIILVGGYSCYQPTIGRKAFPESDYMTIGEADLSVGPLVEALVRGERPHDIPGVFSRFDSPDFTFREAPMPQDLDAIEIPKYDWTDLKLYRNYNRYQLTPIIATRGCRWSRCTFCAERFFWRARSPQNVVDEFQWLYEHGCDLFMFNESDLNGKPEILLAICDEIVRRGLKINLTGQLRINRHSDRNFFDRLRAGGFVALRFGVDAWNTNTLRQQMKGYTPEMI